MARASQPVSGLPVLLEKLRDRDYCSAGHAARLTQEELRNGYPAEIVRGLTSFEELSEG
jgi:hypothetical protein